MDKKRQEIRNSREIREKCDFLCYCILSQNEKEIIRIVEKNIELDAYQNAILQEAYNREKTKSALIFPISVKQINFISKSESKRIEIQKQNAACLEEYYKLGGKPKSSLLPAKKNIRLPKKLRKVQRRLNRLKKRQAEKFNIERADIISSLESTPHPISREAKEKFADMLLRRMTSAEKAVLPELNQLGFLPQRIVLGFIPDFWLPAKKVIVEIDGGYHTEEWKIKEDRVRDEIFRRNGYTVLRFTNDQVSNDRTMVVEQIKKVVSV